MSLLRRRVMMEKKEIVAFSELDISKLRVKQGAINIIGGIGFEFVDIRDQRAELNFIIEAEKEYRIEFDADVEKQNWISRLILNINDVSKMWYLSELVLNYTQVGHYSLYIQAENYDRRVNLIGNLNGNDTGYAYFTNFVIYEI